MPRRFTLEALRTACKQQVDLENHTVISDAEWAGYISRAYGELYTIVFEAGWQYFEYTTLLTTDGTNQLSEVSDHFSTVTLSRQDSAKSYCDLREIQPQERSRMTAAGTGDAQYFEFIDDTIYLFPTPATGKVYQLRYVPQPPDITTYADTDLVDCVSPDGHEFLIWSVAVKAMAKTEADPQLARAEREAARERFTNIARMRTQYSARRVQVDYSDREPMDGERW